MPPAMPIPLQQTQFPSTPLFKLDLYVYEMAARILFYMVHWLRSVKEFQMLHVKDQVSLRCAEVDSLYVNPTRLDH